MKNITGFLGFGRRRNDEPTTPVSTPPQAVELTEYWPTDGWRKAPPEALGFDPKLFAKFERELKTERRIISACVVRRGYLACEHFRDGADDLQMIYSITKSIVSMLTGIAIGDGKLRGADQPLREFFPELDGPKVDPRLTRLTLKDLLTMRSGVKPTDEVLHNLFLSWGEYLAAQKAADEPGKTFCYSSFDPHMISVILQQVIGMDLLAYARARLFGPLGITEVGWPMDNTGVRIGSHGAMLRTLDLAKLGHLLARRGLWNGTQIVPESWIAESTAAHVVQADNLSRYGYLWWLHAKARWGADGAKSGNFFGLGAAGQLLYVAPAEELIAVITSYLPEDSNLPAQIVSDYLLPAVLK